MTIADEVAPTEILLEQAEQPVTQQGRVEVDGKFFSCGGDRFDFRGITYGTFRPRADGQRYPEPEQAKLDLSMMREHGFTVVRTYTPPPEEIVELASEWGLRLLAGIFYPDWRYLVGASKRQQASVLRTARAQVRAMARRFAGDETILALALGNEIPADVIRWIGTDTVGRALTELVDVAKDEDPQRLVTYANYPTAEYLPCDAMDFLTFNVFLEHQVDLRRYLTRLHHLAGERPLVLGELGLSADPGPQGEQTQLESIEWQLTTALERGVAGTCIFSWTDDWWVGDARVEDWRFGLTRSDRSARPVLQALRRWNTRTVADLDVDWPSISVVICAYNAAATIDECLTATCALDYPDLEILVVDDGSTDFTAEIAGHHPRARLLSIPHAGLSVARNAGWAAASGELVAYLDSDAFPSPEWLHYLALGMDGRNVGGVGGPNVPPPGDLPGAHRVAHAPGGPVHVLLADDRAEHIPGCNMAFWRTVLEEVGGFDPIYTSAGDDVDLCWKVLDRGWHIGFHPAALIWHHRRSGLRSYLRQQRGYGRAEALVEARHPDRFTTTGSARWRGHIYSSLRTPVGRQRIYRGPFATAAYQSVYRGGGHGLDLAHQVGVPVAASLAVSAPVTMVWPVLGVLPVLALLFLLGLGAIDAARARPPQGCRQRGGSFRIGVAALHLLQPLARTWGRRHRTLAHRELPRPARLPGPIQTGQGGVLILPDTRPREKVVAAVIGQLRVAGVAVTGTTGWEDHDGMVLGSSLVAGELVTSAYPFGCVQLKLRHRIRWPRLVAAIFLVIAVAIVDIVPAALLAVLGLGELARGMWRSGPVVRRAIRKAAL